MRYFLNSLKLALFIFVSFIIFVGLANSASAQTVISFTASQSIVRSGYSVEFIWDIDSAGGYSFIVPCVDGIKMQSFTCGVMQSSTSLLDDYRSIIFFNFSGGTKYITARLFPKNSSGVDHSPGMREIQVAVETMPQPITGFTAPNLSTSRQTPVVVSWTSQIITGVNLIVECKDEIRVNSSSYSSTNNMPCGTTVFPSPLGTSNSLTLNFNNSSLREVPIKLTLVPAITSSTYDATHGVSLTLNVASDVVPDPVIRTFTASSTAVSGTVTPVTWDAQNVAGVNLKFNCQPAITISSANVSLPCDRNAFADSLPASGSKEIIFTKSIPGSLNVSLILLLSKRPGEYDATLGRTISVTIQDPTPVALSPQVSPPAVSIPPASSPPASSVPTIPSSVKHVFAKTLFRGSKGTDVSKLQEFLKKDSALYPEGLVTGFFGPATERAVQKFQIKYGVVTSGNAKTTGFGAVGPKTRKALNEKQ